MPRYYSDREAAAVRLRLMRHDALLEAEAPNEHRFYGAPHPPPAFDVDTVENRLVRVQRSYVYGDHDVAWLEEWIWKALTMPHPTLDEIQRRHGLGRYREREVCTTCMSMRDRDRERVW